MAFEGKDINAACEKRNKEDEEAKQLQKVEDANVTRLKTKLEANIDKWVKKAPLPKSMQMLRYVGEEVQAYWPPRRRWYDAKILSIDRSAPSITVQYRDGPENILHS